jgi:hypothetical protein
MKTSTELCPEATAPLTHTDTPENQPLLSLVPPNSDEFREIPSNSTLLPAQHADNQSLVRKQALGTFAGKISASQHFQLKEWLADHTYDEVIDLVAIQPPEGFGIKVGKTTLSRYYKAHFEEIDRLRQEHIESRACDMLRRDGHDYRAVLRDAHTQLLLERLWELLSRPVESVDDLKKLTIIAEKMKSLDRDKELLAQLQEEQRQTELNHLFAGLASKTPPKQNP